MPTPIQSILTYRLVRGGLFFSVLLAATLIFSRGIGFAAPVITTQPQSQIISPGLSVTLTVNAAGTPPLLYQWRKDGATLLNRTNSTLVFNNIQPGDEGAYSVIVSDSSGSVTSSVATLGTGFGIQWQINLGGNGDDYASIVRQTSDGGFVVGGYSSSGISGNKTNANFGGYDYWVVKLDANGNKLWERSFGGTQNDYLYSLQQTSDNGIILGGISDSPASGNKASTNFGGFDYWLVKLTADGQKQWEQSFGGSGDDFSYDLEQMPDGGFIVGGESDSVPSGNKNGTNYGGFDYWIICLNTNGTVRWEKVFGGDNEDRFGNLQGTSDGGYILGGSSMSGTSGNKTNAGFGIFDYWVIKIDSVGNKIWERILDSSSTDDYRVVRLDANGGTQWDKTFGGDGTDILYALERAASGGYVLGGYSTSEVSSGKTSSPYGNGDYWMVGVHTNGTQLWDKSLGGDGTDVLSSLQQGRNGGYILAGYSNSGISGNKTNNSLGGYDYWVVKLVVIESVTINSHPQSRTNAPGANVALSVSADNALGYQWRKNGEAILGATSSVFAINNFQTNNVGAYDVVVMGAGANLTSDVAYLFINGIETNSPSLTVVAPRSNERITNNLDVLLRGNAKDKGLGVARILYRLNYGPQLLADGTTTWSAPVTLVPGPNHLQVQAMDFGGNLSEVITRNFFVVIYSQFSLGISGSGQILSTPTLYGTPLDGALLEIGRAYKVQAVPAEGYVFSNWVGSAASSSSTFNFVMQSNMTLIAQLIPNPFLTVAGSYNGLFRQTNISHRTAGFFTMKVKTNFYYSGRMILDGNSIALSGRFEIDGTCTKTVSRAKFGKPDLTLSLALDFANGSDRAIGGVSSESWTASLQADRATFSTENPPSSYTNNYTLLLPGFSDPLKGPPGFGYGSVKIKPNGFIVLAGASPDGIRMTQSVPLSKDGHWPFYAFLYKSTRFYTNWVTGKPATDLAYYLGSASGWINFTNANNTPAGTVRLVKAGWTNAIYAAGFTNETAITGARFVPRPFGSPAFDMNNGTITFNNGNLPATVIGSNVSIRPNNLANVTSAHAIKFSVAPKSGVISGSFQHPQTGNVVPFKGAVLQDEKFGAGHFLGSNLGGLFLLEEN